MWTYIKEVNWKVLCKEDQGYKEGKRILLRTFTQDTCKRLNKFVNDRSTELAKVIEAYEKHYDTRCGEYSGDDSFDDMVNHVIGLGSDFFSEVMENPKLLDGMEFVESFSYCLPDESDYEKLKPELHKTAAIDAIELMVVIFRENKPDKDDFEILHEVMTRLMQIVVGDFKTACIGFDKETYVKYYELFEQTNIIPAIIPNTISNCKDFMV